MKIIIHYKNDQDLLMSEPVSELNRRMVDPEQAPIVQTFMSLLNKCLRERAVACRLHNNKD